mgnify:CR=1 FL=1
MCAERREFTVMAANTTSGPKQRYEGPGIRIFQALKPDICAIQEFNYDGEIDDFIKLAFGEDYKYFRESSAGNFSIPNGIIYHKDFALVDKGSWGSPEIANRGLTWARFKYPDSERHLFVLSLHLSTKGGKQRAEARHVVRKINAYFKVNHGKDIQDDLVIAGDFNTKGRRPPVLKHFTGSGGASDRQIPKDHQKNPNTNASRRRRYDYVLVNASLEARQLPLKVGDSTFAEGLVFDSRVYRPLEEVKPVEQSDSNAQNMQHMAVIKRFSL